MSKFELTAREENLSIYSDLHKDVYGFRPRGVELDDRELESEIFYLSEETGRLIEEDKKREARAVEDFKEWIRVTVEAGAGDEETALRWIVKDKTFYDSQDVEAWVWALGILFTDYGRDLLKRIEEIVEYAEYEAA